MTSTVDPFGRTDKLDDGTLEALVLRFEARGKHPQFSKMLREYLDAMDIAATARVLDIGCGTGLAARTIARGTGFAGTITGVELEFLDNSFDAVVAHTLLSHVDDPLSVLKEAARVVKPGGTLGIFDGDYASLTFGHADPDRGRAYDEALISALVTNPRVMRQLPRLMRAAGLELLACFSYVLSEAGAANFWLSAIEAYRKLVPKSRVMSEDEANAWAAALRRDSDEGVFFGSSNYYAYVARRPLGSYGQAAS